MIAAIDRLKSYEVTKIRVLSILISELALERISHFHPDVDIFTLNFEKEINELGARGIGEIGLAGVAAAITEAVHHATGVRVRELPIKIEDLLTSSILS